MIFLALDKVYKIATKSHNVVELPANTLEVPQVESLQEAIEFAGGEEALREVINGAILSGAKNGATAIIRNGGEGSVLTELIDKAKNYARTFTFGRDSGTSKKAILEGVDSLRALKEQGQLASMDKDELLKLLEASLKI